MPLGCLQGGEAALPAGDDTEDEEEEGGGGDEAMDGVAEAKRGRGRPTDASKREAVEKGGGGKEEEEKEAPQ